MCKSGILNLTRLGEEVGVALKKDRETGHCLGILLNFEGICGALDFNSSW